MHAPNNNLLNTYYVLGTIGDNVISPRQFQQYCEISVVGIVTLVILEVEAQRGQGT